MKPWMPLAICCVLVAAALAFRGCAAGTEKEEESRQAAARGSGSGGMAGGEDDDPGGGKASKTPRRGEPPAHALIRNKLKSIIIPKISFEDTTLEEAIDFMRLRTLELDPDPDPTKKGTSIILRKPRVSGVEDASLDQPAADIASLRIKDLRMENTSAWDLLHLIARETGMEVEITDYGIEMGPR